MIRASHLTLFLVLAACGGAASKPAEPAAAAAAAPLKAPGEARVGDRTRCPVSGEEFVVTASSPSAEYGGKTYYFCCPGCDGKFKADPKKFVNAPGS
ncbi:MAG TPA: YHS domain-containing protein [Polyangiaceae bacterium]|nr:YHS domain-containing protein [Polyangiaceae bacterium]